MDTSYCNSDDDEEGTDGQILKQLKEQCKTKKRKALHSLCSSPKEDYTDRHPEEDECDLEEPISSWKSKISKNQRGKRKSAKKRSSSSPQTEVSVKSDEISTAEDSMQHSPCLPVRLCVKVEDPQTEYTECSDITSSSDDTSHLCAEQEICNVNPDLESAAKISFTEEESDSCTVNEVCFDHLEHVEPNYLLPPIGEETMDAENLRKPCQKSLVFHTSEDKEGHIVHPPLEESSLETNFLVNDHGSDTSNYVQNDEIRKLADRCLIKYDRHDQIVMHDMIRDMGREIVRQESLDPGKRSRLWYCDDILKVLRDGTGTEVVEGRLLNFNDPKDVLVNAKAFEKMNNLWLLHLDYVHLTTGYEHISRRLLWLSGKGFPLNCIPWNFSMEKLVALDLRYSSLKQVWNRNMVSYNKATNPICLLSKPAKKASTLARTHPRFWIRHFTVFRILFLCFRPVLLERKCLLT
ncbi:hypothetical protein RHMOL_Rhmol06G0027400 [Rhododendron molle]|uniref:Uncharacterized protein n=1 Tax=Rhododendron molle TaxID=49168 RepID=A0ACC0N8G1_RHOML|nr:hypothetical protein RHMOL_Rhmol06G0027400 [Rhododendron molle]